MQPDPSDAPGPSPASSSGSGPPTVRGRYLLLGAALFIAVACSAAVFLFLRAAPGGAYTVPVAPSMPLALGDRLSMRAGRQTCDVPVLGIEPDGRVLGHACAAPQLAPLERSALNARTSVYFHIGLAAGDVVLAHNAGTWTRALVNAQEPGRKVRVRPVGPGGAEQLVDQQSLVVVQRAGDAIDLGIDVPLPAGAPLDAGDLVSVREGNAGVPARVEAISGSAARLQRGAGAFPTFQADQTVPVERPVAELWVRAARTIDRVPAGSTVLVREGGGWARRVVVGEAEGKALRLRKADGGEEVRVQQDMLMVRGG